MAFTPRRPPLAVGPRAASMPLPEVGTFEAAARPPGVERRMGRKKSPQTRNAGFGRRDALIASATACLSTGLGPRLTAARASTD